MPEPLVLVERRDHVALVTLNDPERRNAMSQAMAEAFAAEVEALAADAGVRAAVLTGAGRAFSGGGDLGMIGSRASEGEGDGGAAAAIRDTMRSFYGLFLSVRELPFPTLAAVHGHAIGAGLCLALACDLRLVSREAKLALNFVRLGLHPGMGATWTLPRMVRPDVAAELLYTGRIFTGAEAAELGIARRALPPEEVVPEALRLAGEMAGAAPLAVRGVKRALARSAQSSLDAQLDFEAARQAETFQSEDVREGLAAARERRTPRFRGA